MFNEINNSNTKVTYAKISNGMVVVRADETDTKAKKRINKLGNEVYERFYASMVGKIETLKVEDNTFGETEVRIGLRSGENLGIISFNLDSSYGRGFLAQIFNADLSKDLVIAPWGKVLEDGSKRTNLYLNYTDKSKVEYKLPDGSPEVKWLETKKGKVIDPITKAEFDDFIMNKLQEFITTNNLNYNPEMPEHLRDLAEPLTKEEEKQLKEMKNKKAVIEQAVNDDDFFNSFG
jgi:hypothetical protein